MRSTAILLLLALAGAVAVTATASREPFTARLIRLEAARAAPDVALLLADESLALNAVLSQYGERPALRLAAQLALVQHPALAREVLPLYGGEPEFQDLLTRYGPAVLLPISYFLNNDDASLRFLHATGEAVRSAKEAAARLLGGDDVPPPAVTVATAGEPTAVERGWFAVGFIADDGHDFLGQFVLDGNGAVDRVQTERIAEAAGALFSGGIRGVETKLRQDETPLLSDWLWAGVDLAIGAGALKALRAGRAAGAGTRTATRSALVARTVVRGGHAALRVGRYGVPLAVAWAVVRHPSLISGLAAQVAAVAGWPVPLVQGIVWFIVLLPALVVVRWLVRWIIGPLAALTGALARSMARPAPAAGRPADDMPGGRVAPTLGDLPGNAPGGDRRPVRGS